MAQTRVGVRPRPTLLAPTSLGFNYGYEFDGVDERIIMNPLNVSVNTTFSLSCWVKANNVTTNNQCVLGNTSNSSVNKGFQIWAINSKIFFQIKESLSSRILIATSNNISNNTWYNVVINYDGSSNASGCEIYINGVKQAIIVYSNTLSLGSDITSEIFYIGRTGSGAFYDGRIDDVQFYNFELNQTQVSDIYNNGYVTDPTASPVHHWKLGESDTWDGSNWTVVDEQGSLNGTSVNMEEEDRKLGVAYSMAFDGVDESIDFGNILNFPTNQPRAISFWGKVRQSGVQSIAGTWSQSAHTGWGALLVNGTLRFLIGGGSKSDRIYVSGGNVKQDIWGHYVLTYDGSEDSSGVQIYIDGISQSINVLNDNILSTSPVSGNNFIVGESSDNVYQINADFMGISVYDTHLNSSNVDSLYNSGVPVDPRDVSLSPSFFVPLVGSNDSFNGTDWTIVDEINGNNGTSVNMEEADKTSVTP